MPILRVDIAQTMQTSTPKIMSNLAEMRQFCSLSSKRETHKRDSAMYGISVRGITLCLKNTKLPKAVPSTAIATRRDSFNDEQIIHVDHAAMQRQKRFNPPKPNGVATPIRSMNEKSSGIPIGNTGRAPLRR